MAGFNFYLDGNLVDEPEGFDDFQEELILDFDRRVLRFDYPLTLTFVGDGYDYIEAAYQNSIDSEINLQITDDRQGQNKLIANCRLRMVNCEWNINKMSVECEIDDSIYQSRLFNNQKSEVYADAENSITGNPITQLTPIDLITYDPLTGTDSVNVRAAYDLKDCFTMLVEYLTDGAVTFESTWYDELANDERIAVIPGVVLRNYQSDRVPLLSLEKLFKEVWKKFNLFFIIENPLDAPVLRLESYSYVFDTNNTIQINLVNDLKRSLDFDQFYSTVRIGSNEYIRDYGTTYQLPYFQFFGFSEETYTVDTSNAGGDNELDLVSQYVFDTNVIQDIINNGSDDYDDDTFFIQYNISNSTATKGTYYPGTDPNYRYYNELFLNLNVAERFNFAGNLILNNGLDNVDFRASSTNQFDQSAPFTSGPTPTTNPVLSTNTFPYNDDFTAPNFNDGDYNNGTYQYTAPEDGLYRFRWSIEIYRDVSVTFPSQIIQTVSGYTRLLVDGSDNYNPDTYIVTQNNATTIMTYAELLGNFAPTSDFIAIPPPFYWTNAGVPGRVTIQAERSIFLNATQTVSIQTSLGSTNSSETDQPLKIVFDGGTFETIQTPGIGGDYSSSSQDDAFVNVYTADKLGIGEEDWEQVRVNPVVKFKLDTNGQDFRIAFGKKISRKFVTGETEIETLYKRNQPYI